MKENSVVNSETAHNIKLKKGKTRTCKRNDLTNKCKQKKKGYSKNNGCSKCICCLHNLNRKDVIAVKN